MDLLEVLEDLDPVDRSDSLERLDSLVVRDLLDCRESQVSYMMMMAIYLFCLFNGSHHVE